MISETHITLTDPDISIPWGRPRKTLIKHLTPHGLQTREPDTNVIWFQHCTLVSGIFGSFSMSGFSFKNAGLSAARIHPVGGGSSTESLKSFFCDIQDILISHLGAPCDSYPKYGFCDEKPFDGYKWTKGHVEIRHDITERFGPNHLIWMEKKRST